MFRLSTLDVFRNKEKYFLTAFSILAGFLAYYLIIGPFALHPNNIAWLSNGDPSTHYLGWLFFRNSEWSFPLGLNPNYGLEISNAIIYSDSNPLFAFIFKIFSKQLSETFQYTGLWLLICFILQIYFAFKLIGIFTQDKLILMLASCFFIFAPPMLGRLHAHFSLVGHFLILTSLYLSLLPWQIKRTSSWIVLLVVTVLIHPYIFVMVSLIWGSDILGRTQNRCISFKNAFIEFTSVILTTLLACWQSGYFSVSDGVSLYGYGFYRMNLLSIFDSSGWSYFLNDIPEGEGDYEGFNFLGTGIIFIGIFSLAGLFVSDIKIFEKLKKRPTLLIVITLLTIFAVSNRIGIGEMNFDIELGNSVKTFVNIFRASGRMFWPVFYLMYFLIIYIIIRTYNKKIAITILGIGLLIQIADTSKGWLDLRSKFMIKPNQIWETTMVSPFWEEASTKYNKLRWFMPENNRKNWQPLAIYAGTNHLATNSVYLGRIGSKELANAQKSAQDKLINGQFDPDSLYVVDSKLIPKVALNINKKRDLIAFVDGYYVIAPGWKQCTECSKVVGELDSTKHNLPLVEVNKRILFNQDNTGPSYLGLGWSQTEPWGTWSDGESANINLPLKNLDIDSLTFESNILLNAVHTKQIINVKINGIMIKPIILNKDTGGYFKIVIPSKAKEQINAKSLINIVFNFPNAVSPSEIGMNHDLRKLGIGLVALTIN